jgi:hypothetical protein
VCPLGTNEPLEYIHQWHFKWGWSILWRMQGSENGQTPDYAITSGTFVHSREDWVSNEYRISIAVNYSVLKCQEVTLHKLGCSHDFSVQFSGDFLLVAVALFKQLFHRYIHYYMVIGTLQYSPQTIPIIYWREKQDCQVIQLHHALVNGVHISLFIFWSSNCRDAKIIQPCI